MKVVKLGGSLMDTAREVTAVLKGYEVLIVPGGGPFADAVRTAYDEQGLSEEAAHSMAVRAMDQYGLFLSDISGVPITRDPLETRLPAVLLPWSHMEKNDPFEPSWDITADTIACRIAHVRGEEEFILLKSADGGVEVVDRVLPFYLKKWRMGCRVLNGRKHEMITSALAGEPVGTQIP